MVTLDDLMTPLTLDEARQSIYDVGVNLGLSTTSWKPGAVVRTILALVAVIAVAVSTVVALIARAGFLEYATGAWLTLLSRDRYKIERIAATFATGEVTLTNTKGGVYNADPREYVFQNPTTKRTYWNSAAFTLGSGTEGSPTVLTIPIVAVEAGSASTSAPGTITGLVTPMNGVAVTNAASVVGVDDETDDQLRVRDDASLDALSPFGPEGAYLAAARSACRADGSNIGVTRVRVSDPSEYGDVAVIVATASGGVTGPVGTEGTDLWYVNKAIQENAVPHGITASVASATTQAIAITYDLFVYTTDSRTADELKAVVLAALTAWMPTRPIGGDDGGKIYQSAIRSMIMNAVALARGSSVVNYAFRCDVSLPAGDTALSAGQIATLGTVTPTVTLVSP
jgi:phage-related baseplate assembly protein